MISHPRASPPLRWNGSRTVAAVREPFGPIFRTNSSRCRFALRREGKFRVCSAGPGGQITEVRRHAEAVLLRVILLPDKIEAFLGRVNSAFQLGIFG